MLAEWFRDPRFRGDITLQGPRHGDGVWATWPGDPAVVPAWDVAQWGLYRNTLMADTPCTDLPKGGKRWGNAAASVTFRPSTEADVRLELNGSVEYAHPRRPDELWPHLLIEQSTPDARDTSFDDLSSLRYRCRFLLERCDRRMTEEEYDPGLHGVQVHQFLTVGDGKDYFWFGIPYFDSREPALYPGYCCIDGEGSDIEGFSGKLIRTMPQERFTTTSAFAGEWLTYDVDLLPMFRECYDLAKKKGLLRETEWKDLRVTSTNVGFELFGTFDCVVQMADMHLIADIK